MKKSSQKGWLDYLIYLIWAFILFVAIWDLFHIPGRAVFWFGELIFSVFIYYKLKVPISIYFGILALFLVNLFGELFFGLFYIIPYFDKLLHLLSPLIACTLFYFIFEKEFKDKKMLIFFSVTLLLSWELFWEVLEYFADQQFHTLLAGVHLMGVQAYESTLEIVPKYEDTIYDMFYNLIGSIVFAVAALFFTRKKKSKIKKH
ncbi:hypothetical protein J4411_02990 [Candidatus Pacearchaeota archaeon]|nr:hypothetical protein [Candidatus Pacearchaeota archaeon]